MKIWQSLFKRLEEYGERIERERRYAYLAEATDVHDLSRSAGAICAPERYELSPAAC